MTEWLDRRADALARATTVDRAALELDVHEVETLLDVAAHAAHDSGDRRNAPLLCYLLGRATSNGRTIDELAEIVRSTS